MRKGLAVRGPLLAVACALACWLLLAAPAHAEQAPDPLAALARAGAPLVAAAPPSSAGPTPEARPMAASTAAPIAPAPGTAPAIGIPGLPSPSDLLSGLDPREWAVGILDGAVSALGRELLGAMRSFIDWALGFGDSSLNFVTRTPAAGSYESPTVRSLWDFSRAIANAGLALVVMWGGFNVMVRQHIGSPYHGAMELLPRVILAALAVNLTLEFAGVLIEVNNAFAAAIGQVGLPGYEQATVAQEGIALVFASIAYAVMALLLVFQMLIRLALLDVLIVLSPLMVLLWVLPQTQGWTRWWAHLFPITVLPAGGPARRAAPRRGADGRAGARRRRGRAADPAPGNRHRRPDAPGALAPSRPGAAGGHRGGRRARRGRPRCRVAAGRGTAAAGAVGR